MLYLDNFLESNHPFSDSELPLKFKFRLMNTIMGIIVFTAILFGTLHYVGVAPLGNFHANMNFAFAAVNLLLIVWLRRNKEAYEWVVTLMLLSSLANFTSALIKVTHDEFRIMWFYIALFLAFFAGGMVHGYAIAALSIIIIFISNTFFDLHLSTLAITTAITGIIILTITVQAYTRKMLDLEQALLTLNSTLHSKVESAVEEVRQKDKMMLQQARLAQMGEMIAMIAHQWRQPLSSISAISAKLQLTIAIERGIDMAALTHELQNIDNRVHLLSNTIDDFRNFYNINNKKSAFDLSKTIQQTIEVLKPATENAQITLHYENSLSLFVNSLEGELLQVVMNLIKNAIDVLKECETDRTIWIRTYQNSRNVFISVEDSGGGIKPEIIERIFDPYFSTKKEKNGMGLGLYMSQLIIQKHCQGSLEVENTSRGAHFSICLPL